MCIVGWGPGAADCSQVFVPSGSQSLVLAYSGVGVGNGGVGEVWGIHILKGGTVCVCDCNGTDG